MKIYNFEQNTPEWDNIRKCKLTASEAYAIANCGKGLETLCRELVVDYKIGKEKKYTNEAMEDGHMLEEEARARFRFETGLETSEVGFVEYNEFVGCSPDGFTSDDCLVEIKNFKHIHFLEYATVGEIPKEYYNQIQMQMLVCEKKYCYFVVYNFDFKNPIIIKKIEADLAVFDKLKAGFKKGEELIKLYLSMFKKENKNG